MRVKRLKGVIARNGGVLPVSVGKLDYFLSRY